MKRWLSYIFIFLLIGGISRSAVCQWEQVGYPLTAGWLSNLYDDSGTLYSCFNLGFEAGIFRSTNHGLTWDADTSGMGLMSVYVILNKSGWLFAAADSGIYVSNDKGISWVRTLWKTATVLTNSGDTLFAIGPDDSTVNIDHVYRSIDNGINWGIVSDLPGFSAYQLESADGSLFAWAGLGLLYRSITGGESWSIDTLYNYEQYSDISTHALASNGNSIYALDSSGIYISSDGGNLWLMQTELPGDTGAFIWLGGQNGILLSIPKWTGKPALSISQDNGAEWKSIPMNGLSDSATGIFYAATSGIYLIIGVDGQYDSRTFWRMPLADLSVDNSSLDPIAPAVYPNPTSKTLNIFPGINATSVELFDPLGREVLSKNIGANGSFDVSSVPNGNYEAVLHLATGTVTVPVIIQH